MLAKPSFKFIFSLCLIILVTASAHNLPTAWQWIVLVLGTGGMIYALYLTDKPDGSRVEDRSDAVWALVVCVFLVTWFANVMFFLPRYVEKLLGN